MHLDKTLSASSWKDSSLSSQKKPTPWPVLVWFEAVEVTTNRSFSNIEVCCLLGCYALWIGPRTCWPLKMGPIGCFQKSVRNYQSAYNPNREHVSSALQWKREIILILCLRRHDCVFITAVVRIYCLYLSFQLAPLPYDNVHGKSLSEFYESEKLSENFCTIRRCSTERSNFDWRDVVQKGAPCLRSIVNMLWLRRTYRQTDRQVDSCSVRQPPLLGLLQ